MKNKNLEQIRAENAYKATKDAKYAGKGNGEIAKKVPSYIRENGLLATLAFALEKKGKSGDYANDGMKRVLDAVAGHLADSRIARLNASDADSEAWIKYLIAEASSDELRDQTAETMAYLSYFRRFAHKEE